MTNFNSAASSRRPKPLPQISFLMECFELRSDVLSGLVWKSRPKEHFEKLRTWK